MSKGVFDIYWLQRVLAGPKKYGHQGPYLKGGCSR